MNVGDFGGDVDKWVEHASKLLSQRLSLSEWVKNLEEGRDTLRAILELWDWLAFWDSREDEQFVLEQTAEFRWITTILSAWCDQSRRFDPTSLLQACDALERVNDAAPQAGLLEEVSAELWNEWFAARKLARVLIRRIRLHLDAQPGSTEEKSRMDFNKTFDKIRDEWKDIVAVGLLFHSGGTMTKTAIAERLNYDGPGSLKRLRVFNFWGTRGAYFENEKETNEYGEKTSRLQTKETKAKIEKIMANYRREWSTLMRQESELKGHKRGRKKQPKKRARKQRF